MSEKEKPTGSLNHKTTDCMDGYRDTDIATETMTYLIRLDQKAGAGSALSSGELSFATHFFQQFQDRGATLPPLYRKKLSRLPGTLKNRGFLCE